MEALLNITGKVQKVGDQKRLIFPLEEWSLVGDAVDFLIPQLFFVPRLNFHWCIEPYYKATENNWGTVVFFVLINQAAWKTSKCLLKSTASVKLTKKQGRGAAERRRVLKISLRCPERSRKKFSAEQEQCSIQPDYPSDQSWTFPTVKDCRSFGDDMGS